ncbi:MAG: aspartate 1-decarboxylase [Metallibacterium sp.]
MLLTRALRCALHRNKRRIAPGVDNGERLVTCAIRAEEGSGTISVNGAAARCVRPGHLLTIAAWAQMDAAAEFQPMLVYVDAQKRMTHSKRSFPGGRR